MPVTAAPATSVSSRAAAPVIAWASLGAISVVLVAVVLGRWLWSGVGSVPPGSDAISDQRLWLLRAMEWSQFVALLVLLWLFVGRPIRRRAGLAFDGYFVLAALALNVWDPLDNYLAFSFQYNAHMVNVRSWGGFIPGWSSGEDVWAVPVLFVLGAYTWAFFGAARWGDLVLRTLTEHRPGWGPVRRGVAVVAASSLIAAVAEVVYLTTGSIANISTPDPLTVNADSYAGWPLYNPLLFGVVFALAGWLRSSRDEAGLSVVERGVDLLPVAASVRGALRFLAIFAFLEVVYIGLYFLPWNLFALTAGPPPDLPSYFPLPSTLQ